MSSSDDEAVEEVAADAFTPVKIAVRNSNVDFWSCQTRKVEQPVKADVRPARNCWYSMALRSGPLLKIRKL